MATETLCLLPGYSTIDRIGAGGYGEVWRVQAPGGVEKAIKVVYGFHDQELATRELKALERIKNVRHPFVLSLERFEIIDGRLAILTELAEMSLEQRFQQCRAQGHVGIPRDELLRYMVDAAEALDVLGDQHSLQHLDIKPENLLLLGGHLKVADFGLVKELVSRTNNSMIGGMTPSYAAPEMFDDRPCARTDQYSLAIVYQEMLTGVLPFPGRTAAQLAKQHTQADPNLRSLPAAERAVVRRALAKRPDDRFESIRAFVQALIHEGVADAGSVIGHSPAPRSGSGAEDDTACTASGDTHAVGDNAVDLRTEQVGAWRPSMTLSSVTEAAAFDPYEVEEEVAEDVTDVPTPPAQENACARRPTMFVGIGGAGTQVVSLLPTLLSLCHDGDWRDAFPLLAIDVDRDTLSAARMGKWGGSLEVEDTLHTPLRRPQQYRDDTGELLQWISRRWLYNIPRSLQTRGFRPLGRLALVDHAASVLSTIKKRLQHLAAVVEELPAEADSPRPLPKVVLIASPGGGTGSGMFLDLAYGVRALAADLGVEVEIQGVLCYPGGAREAGELTSANTYSLLVELQHATRFGNRGEAPSAGLSQYFEADTGPFNHLYFVPPTQPSTGQNGVEPLLHIARYLAVDAATIAGGVLDACRREDTAESQSHRDALQVRGCGCISIDDQRRSRIDVARRKLVEAVWRQWLGDQPNDPPPPAVDAEEEAPRGPSSRLALAKACGPTANTRFARDLLDWLEGRMAVSADGIETPLSPRVAERLAEQASEAFRSTRLNFTSASEPIEVSDSSEGIIPDAVRRITRSAIDEYCRELERLRRDPDQGVAGWEGRLEREAAHLLECEGCDSSLHGLLAALSGENEDAGPALEEASPRLLGCGHERRTLLLAPSDDSDPEKWSPFVSARSTAAVVPAQVDQPTLICEASGVVAAKLAGRLVAGRPDIVDAAGRLHSRRDIQWSSLSERSRPSG